MTIFTAIDPNGVTHTRNSKARTYTHMVVGRPSWTGAVKRVSCKEARAVHFSNFKYQRALADGRSQWLEGLTVEDRDARIASAQALLNGCKTGHDYSDKMVKNSLAIIEKKLENGHYDKYQDLGWCGRPDLAEKLKIRSVNIGWFDVTILQVTC
jgi:hypothetical protein